MITTVAAILLNLAKYILYIHGQLVFFTYITIRSIRLHSCYMKSYQCFCLLTYDIVPEPILSNTRTEMAVADLAKPYLSATTIPTACDRYTIESTTLQQI